MSEIILDANQSLVIAIIAYFLGRMLVNRIGVLDRFRRSTLGAVR